MKIPSYEEQNQWVNDYIAPIMINLDIGKVVQNYRRNKREALRNDMANTGVFKSLERLEREGTSWDKIMSEVREGIKNAERAKMYKTIDFSALRDLFPIERDTMKICYVIKRERIIDNFRK